MNTTKPSALRNLFTTLMVSGYSIKLITSDNECMKCLISDYLLAYDNNQQLSVNKFFRSIEIELNKQNKSLSEYGYPVPRNMETPLEMEKLFWDKDQQQIELDKLMIDEPMNELQTELYNTISNEILYYSKHRNLLTESKFYFIDGDAGVGKSSVMRKLHAFCRSKEILIGICAATTLAALNFKKGNIVLVF